MAGNKIILKIQIHYFIVITLITIRIIADVYNFPLDGYTIPPKNSDIIAFFSLYLTLYYMFCVFFMYHKLDNIKVSLFALITFCLYSFTHFIEYFFNMGGRAPFYPPTQNFFLNLISGFWLTNDAGFWQKMRIIFCGIFAVFILKKEGRTYWNIAGSLLILYIWGVLRMHPKLWLFIPNQNAITTTTIEAGILTNIISIYELGFLSTISYINLKKFSLNDTIDFIPAIKNFVVWTGSFILYMFFAPVILPQIHIHLIFLLVLCSIILRVCYYGWVYNQSHISQNIIGMSPRITAGILSNIVVIVSIKSGWLLVIGYAVFSIIEKKLRSIKRLTATSIPSIVHATGYSIYFYSLNMFLQ